MTTSSELRALLTWALGTFHATVLVLTLVLVLYSRDTLGQLLATLNTAVGLGLFVALWATTFFATGRALHGVDLLAADFDARRFERRALRWGGINGVLFLAVLALVLVVTTLLSAPAGANPMASVAFFGAVAPLALVIAWGFGAAIGMILGTVDLALLAAARALLRAGR